MLRRHLMLTTLVVLTVLVLLVDVVRPTWTAPITTTASRVAGPVLETVAGWTQDEVSVLRHERDALAVQVAQLQAERELSDDLVELSGVGTGLVPGRVVGFAPGSAPVGLRTVTLDIGADDGVLPNQTVVNVDGLVGRVVRTTSTTSDVAVLGDAEVVVGVRVGEGGALGTVSGLAAPGLPARGAGELTLRLVGTTEIAVGDEVVTLGSPDSVPYSAGVALGTVTAVDPESGRLGRTAVVTPAVDLDALDLVAVVVVGRR